MTRKLGELGCTPTEARDRLKRLLKLGVADLLKDSNVPLTQKERKFIEDMVTATNLNKDFEPSYGQVTFAQDIYEKYCS